MAKSNAKRARADWTVNDADLTVDPKYLYAKAVPVSKRPTKEELEIDSTLQTLIYGVHIQFSSFEDMKMRACEKVLHTVGHAISEGKIKFTDNPDEMTVVDSSGYPPAHKAEKTKEAMNTLVDTAKTDEEKTEMAKYMADLMKKLGIKPADLANMVK